VKLTDIFIPIEKNRNTNSIAWSIFLITKANKKLAGGVKTIRILKTYMCFRNMSYDVIDIGKKIEMRIV